MSTIIIKENVYENQLSTQAILQLHLCPHCGKSFKRKGWFNKHLEPCAIKTHKADRTNILTNEQPKPQANQSSREFPFYFDESLFSEEDDKSQVTLLDSSTDKYDISCTINSKINPGSFKIMHLNINSAFNKFEHIIEILNSADIDILTLNETKLDDETPDRYFEHNNYNTLRRNRNSHGGGILVLVKKCYQISEKNSSTEYEIISFKLKLNGTFNNFIISYKPPSTPNEAYLDHLETYIGQFNLNNNLFIVGDLNMDWLSNRGDQLKEFSTAYNLENFIKDPTRVFQNKNGRTTSSLIDVVLHNGSKINSTHTIDFPFSDHKILLIECKFKAKSSTTQYTTRRNLNKANLEKIAHDLNLIDWSSIDTIIEVEDKYAEFNKIFNTVLDKHAPIQNRQIKIKEQSLPWYDSELKILSHKCHKKYKKAKLTQLPNHQQLKIEATELRQKYQRLLRDKKIAFFANKSPKDFKASKKFWQLYQGSIKMRSDKARGLRLPDSIQHNGSTITDPIEITNSFNKHFSSFSSAKNVSTEDCHKYILKSLKASCPKAPEENFKFKHTTSSEVERLIKDLDNNASPGISPISVLLLKANLNTLLTPITKIFNNAIEQSKIPSEWKTAVLSPLFKN